MILEEGETFAAAFRAGMRGERDLPTEEDFLDEIDRWHSGAGEGQSLATFLGMSWPEYKAWAEGDDLFVVLS